MYTLMSRAEKKDFLFRFVPPDTRRHLLLDDEALYSTTDQLTAEKITKDLLKYVPKTGIVTDATACVGGNTYSFAQSFSQVFSFEKDATRVHYLDQNMQVLGMSNVTIKHGDGIELCTHQIQDVIFLDPPWGGPEYKHVDKIELFLSNQTLSSICEKISPYTSFIAIKAPTNFDEVRFIKDTQTFMDLKHKNTQLRKMHFYIFKTHDSFQTVL